MTSTTSSDEVIVDRISFTGRPGALPNGDIVVPFNAFRANGTAIPPAFIDSPEFRAAANPQVRFEAGRGIVVERRPGCLPGQLRVRYKAPFRPARNRPGWNQPQLRRALLGDGHAIGFGHVEVLPREGMLVDGLTDNTGSCPGLRGRLAGSEGPGVRQRRRDTVGDAGFRTPPPEPGVRLARTRAPSGYFRPCFSPVGALESAAMKASWGTSTRPTIFIRFLPSFCFSSSLRLRVMSPP